jgi:alkylation response protein AidB-like acyl-CoA dehydrogenase
LRLERAIIIGFTSGSSFGLSAGKFLTERPGGSDVSQTETSATPVDGAAGSPGSKYLLNGLKWSSSAKDGEVALVLVRTGDNALGACSLSLFLMPLRIPLVTGSTPTPPSILPRTNENNNGILVHRLKNKFGTHPVPTAELSLNGSEAYLVGPLNQGVKSIAPVLQLTRIHSSFASVGLLSRALSIARSFA